MGPVRHYPTCACLIDLLRSKTPLLRHQPSPTRNASSGPICDRPRLLVLRGEPTPPKQPRLRRLEALLRRVVPAGRSPAEKGVTSKGPKARQSMAGGVSHREKAPQRARALTGRQSHPRSLCPDYRPFRAPRRLGHSTGGSHRRLMTLTPSGPSRQLPSLPLRHTSGIFSPAERPE